MQSTLNSSEPPVWDQIQPQLDDVLSHLGKKDRDAVILRYFGEKSLGEVAAALKVTEAAAQPVQKEDLLRATSEDTVRSRSWTGKPARMRRNDWTEAWEAPENPKPLGMPLQGLVSADAMRRTCTYVGVADTVKVVFNPCGQVIGQINQVETSRGVVTRLLEEFVDAVDNLQGLLEAER